MGLKLYRVAAIAGALALIAPAFLGLLCLAPPAAADHGCCPAGAGWREAGITCCPESVPAIARDATTTPVLVAEVPAPTCHASPRPLPVSLALALPVSPSTPPLVLRI